jgi:hypothetical protein
VTLTRIPHIFKDLLRETAFQRAGEWAFFADADPVTAPPAASSTPGRDRGFRVRRASLTAAGAADVPTYQSGVLRPDRGDLGARQHAIRAAGDRSWQHTACGLPVVVVDRTVGDWRELPAARQCEVCHLEVTA